MKMDIRLIAVKQNTHPIYFLVGYLDKDVYPLRGGHFTTFSVGGPALDEKMDPTESEVL